MRFIMFLIDIFHFLLDQWPSVVISSRVKNVYLSIEYIYAYYVSRKALIYERYNSVIMVGIERM